MKTWYAVQETREDAWDYGSHDKEKAIEMLREQGRGLIAVINEENNYCEDEIWFDEIDTDSAEDQSGKKISLIKLTAESNNRPADLFGCAINQSDLYPEVFEVLNDTPENRKKAAEWLATKKNTCEYRKGFANNFYYITAYAAEYWMADEDGDLLEGSDYDPAEDEEGDPA